MIGSVASSVDGPGEHVDLETLRRFVACEIEEALAESIERHLDSCSACRESVVAIVESGVVPWWQEDLLGAADFSTRRSNPMPDELPRRPESHSETATAAIPIPSPYPNSIANYVFVRKIARGGMGTVFEARDEITGRRVALKVVEAFGADPQSLSRVLVEAQAMARLSHPSIVSVSHVLLHDDRPVLVMEFLDGVTVERWQRKEVIDPHLAARLIREMALAVDYAHSQGVVHRDLKPSNVMLIGEAPVRKASYTDTEVKLKITDFGIARILDQQTPMLTRTGEILGTPAYMSPEQSVGNPAPVGPPADIYGLGAILYELLTGKPPFVSSDPIVTLRLIRETDPISPKLLRNDLPADIVAICMKCLEKYPGRRYPTAVGLADDLQAFLSGRPVSAKPLGRIGRSVRWCSRNRLLASSAVAICGSLLLLAIGGFLSARRQVELLAEAKVANQQAINAWRTGINRMADALDALLASNKSQKISLDQAPPEQRKCFEEWAALCEEYLRGLACPGEWGYAEVLTFNRLMFLRHQLNPDEKNNPKLLELIDRAIIESRRLLKEDPTNSELMMTVCYLNKLMAERVSLAGGKPSECLPYAYDSLRICERALELRPSDRNCSNNLISYRLVVADQLEKSGDRDGAIRQAVWVIDFRLRSYQPFVSIDDDRLGFAKNLETLAGFLVRARRSDEALQRIAEARALIAERPFEGAFAHEANETELRIKNLLRSLDSGS